MFALVALVTLTLEVSSVLSISPVKDQIPLSRKNQSPFTDQFDDLVSQNLDRWHVPGLSIAVVDGEETFSKGYGTAIFPTENVTDTTLFWVGSTTKAFTAAIVALLIDDSVNSSAPLTWQTTVSSIIRDDFVLQDEYATMHVTLEDALSHRTGMPRHDASYGGIGWTVRDVARNLRNLPMTAEIRQKFQYCNMMFMTMAHLIETLTGQWLGDLLSLRIWKPLAMTRTYFSFRQAQLAVDKGAASLAQGYMWNNVTEEYIPVAAFELPEVSGAGGIISNVVDYAKWLRFLMDKAAPLSEAGHIALRTPRINLEVPPDTAFTGVSAYGLGWELSNYHGEPLIMHDGGLPGFGAKIAYLPRKQWGFAMMGNTAGTSNIVHDMLAQQLLDDKLEIPIEERVPRRSFLEDIIKQRAERLHDPKKYLYPNAPTGEKTIPLARPLEAYTGNYSHPGYQNLTISLIEVGEVSAARSASTFKTLHSRIERTWPWVFDLEHVSGEYFILRGYMDLQNGTVDKNDPLEVATFKAEFRLGEDGEVKEFGASLEEEMGEQKIWFKKIF